MTKREVEEYIMSQIFPNASHEVTAQNVRNAFAPIVERVWTFLEGEIGDLSQLQTTDKQSVVNAINAVLSKLNHDITLTKQGIATLGSKVGDFSKKAENISTESATSEEDAIVITTDAGVEVGKIDESGADFKNLKSNGKEVLTEHQDISQLATKTEVSAKANTTFVNAELAKKQDVINGITSESTASEEDAIVFESDKGVQVGKIDSNGADFKNLSKDGKSVLTTDDKLVEGEGIHIEGNVISSTGGVGDLPISKESTTEEQDYIDVTNESGEHVMKVTSEKVMVKGITDMEGNPIGGGGDSKSYYFTKSQISPICNTPPLVYEADTKSASNYIVNAVVYPNGEIIVCRRGGVVAKVSNDGTETTLMTISGASDWRGVFMDSNLNVYVSPHASVDGSGFAMTDRGLYKLAYGSSSFVKVISLYNPSSSDIYETQENDDTIWTMCEDADGYLYGGVYCHSQRYAPRIYRSTDGGDTWEDYFNFRPMLPSGHHVHCITYNQYNNALYAIIGEVNTILKSTDHGASWINLNAKCEGGKGTALLAVPDGLIIGSDSGYELIMSKLYSDDKTVRTCGRAWANVCFGTRISDVTGWIYSFGKIDSSVNLTAYMPPVEALTDESVLNNWIASKPANIELWKSYNTNVKDLYPNDAIRPQHFGIYVSKDNGETWEVAYREQVPSTSANGIWTVGYFKNGECLCGRFIGKKVQKPLIVKDGKACYSTQGIDKSKDIFGKI